MKKLIFIYILFSQFTPLKAQEWCDSTFSLCDSISIDSVIFTTFPSTGDRVHFYMTTNHEFLHGSVFYLCPVNDSIDFVNDMFPYSGIMGPSIVHPYYEFLNYHIVGDTLEGNIMVVNTANSFNNCMIDFKIALPEEINSLRDNRINMELKVYPNPAKHQISIQMQNDHNVDRIRLIDFLGNRYELSNKLPDIDIGNIPSGLYILQIEFERGLISEKIFIE